MVCTSTVIVGRRGFSDAGGFDPALRWAEDLDLWLRLLADGGECVVVDETLVSYYMHAAGASADYEHIFRARSAVISAHKRRARSAGDAGTARAARRGLARGRELAGAQAFDVARVALRERRPDGLVHLARAAVRNPRLVGGSLRRSVRDVFRSA
jgi:GT2 family glycosyltransferase